MRSFRAKELFFVQDNDVILIELAGSNNTFHFQEYAFF
jgi:hypothetical protein